MYFMVLIISHISDKSIIQTVKYTSCTLKTSYLFHRINQIRHMHHPEFRKFRHWEKATLLKTFLLLLHKCFYYFSLLLQAVFNAISVLFTLFITYHISYSSRHAKSYSGKQLRIPTGFVRTILLSFVLRTIQFSPFICTKSDDTSSIWSMKMSSGLPELDSECSSTRFG